MADKKNLCAMISTELHAKVIEEKERLEMHTLGDYMELILKEHFEGGKTIMEATKTFAIQLPAELIDRLQAYLKAESDRQGRKISQKEFIRLLIEEALEEAGA